MSVHPESRSNFGCGGKTPARGDPCAGRVQSGPDHDPPSTLLSQVSVPTLGLFPFLLSSPHTAALLLLGSAPRGTTSGRDTTRCPSSPRSVWAVSLDPKDSSPTMPRDGPRDSSLPLPHPDLQSLYENHQHTRHGSLWVLTSGPAPCPLGPPRPDLL